MKSMIRSRTFDRTKTVHLKISCGKPAINELIHLVYKLIKLNHSFHTSIVTLPNVNPSFSKSEQGNLLMTTR